jgi:hypothetical protein
MSTFLKIVSLVMRSIYWLGWLVVALVALPIIGFFVAGIVGDQPAGAG